MCINCAEEYGAPAPVTEEMRTARRLTEEIHDSDWGTAGGPLHCEIDDCNVDDHWFTPACRDLVVDSWDQYYRERHGDAGLDLSLRTWDALAALTEAQRATVVCYDYQEGF